MALVSATSSKRLIFSILVLAISVPFFVNEIKAHAVERGIDQIVKQAVGKSSVTNGQVAIRRAKSLEKDVNRFNRSAIPGVKIYLSTYAVDSKNKTAAALRTRGSGVNNQRSMPGGGVLQLKTIPASPLCSSLQLSAVARCWRIRYVQHFPALHQIRRDVNGLQTIDGVLTYATIVDDPQRRNCDYSTDYTQVNNENEYYFLRTSSNANPEYVAQALPQHQVSQYLPELVDSYIAQRATYTKDVNGNLVGADQPLYNDGLGLAYLTNNCRFMPPTFMTQETSTGSSTGTPFGSLAKGANTSVKITSKYYAPIDTPEIHRLNDVPADSITMYIDQNLEIDAALAGPNPKISRCTPNSSGAQNAWFAQYCTDYPNGPGATPPYAMIGYISGNVDAYAVNATSGSTYAPIAGKIFVGDDPGLPVTVDGAPVHDKLGNTILHPGELIIILDNTLLGPDILLSATLTQLVAKDTSTLDPDDYVKSGTKIEVQNLVNKIQGGGGTDAWTGIRTFSFVVGAQAQFTNLGQITTGSRTFVDGVLQNPTVCNAQDQRSTVRALSFSKHDDTAGGVMPNQWVPWRPDGTSPIAPTVPNSGPMANTHLTYENASFAHRPLTNC